MNLRPTNLLVLLHCSFVLVGPEVPAQPVGEVLTNAADILALPAERAAQGVPVAVRGVVTVAEKYWDGRFFVQDTSGGVFVDNISTAQPGPGDVVEVSGVSHPGAFAPGISQPIWKIVGTAPLPAARPVPVERLMSGIEDGQRVEIAGIVRTVGEDHGLLSLDIVSGGYRSHVFAPRPPGLELPALIGATIRVRGTAAASFNAQLRQMLTTKVFVPQQGDFIVEECESTDPFSKPAVPLAGIAQYRPDNAPGNRVHVRATVTYQRLGEDLFMQDEKGGLHIRSRERTLFAPGEVIEAVGFPTLDHFLPVLEDASFRKSGLPRAAVIAKAASPAELQAGLHHANLITVRARLLDRVVRRSLDRTSEGMQVKTLMTMQSDSLVFSAEAETLEEPEDLVSVPIGSTLEITGVCLSEIDADGKLKLLRLLVPAGQLIRILQTPGWLTPQRLSLTLIVVFAVLLVALSWNLVVSRKNSALKILVKEKEHAQQELQQAHQLLEARVQERTEQLKLQITARKESELQFKAVLSERTRLAQELHDTLEQSLTGIALQMDTAARLVEKKPADANRHLSLARSLVGQGQVEVRRSVWDLRSRSSQQFDLPAALASSSRQLTDGTGIEVEVAAQGRVRPLPDNIEDNLLRIAQEALTNVIKHSGATVASIELDYGPKIIRLRVTDNGCGFATDDCVGPLDGHFGLLGISERVKRLNGQVTITSASGTGTVVAVSIPLEYAPEFSLPVFAGLDV